MGIIYKLTSPSNKSYIGQTTQILEIRIKQHCNKNSSPIIHAAIKKYGINNFNIDILIECTDEQLDMYEKQYITLYNTVEPNGYNIRDGGSNGKHSAASKEKMRQKKLGKNNPNFGKPRSDEFKLIMKQKKSGSNHHYFGKNLTNEHKLKLSRSHKKEDIPMYLVRIKERPEIYHYGGYAVVNHPVLKNKHFTSKKFTDEEKYQMAFDYLNSITEKVQRLNVSGEIN
jgi:group I intron endonuclease